MKFVNRAKISIYKFYCFNPWNKHCAYVRPRVKGGVAIIATDVRFANCEKEANFMEVTKVCHTLYKGRGRLLPKWYPRKFCLSR